MARPPTSQSPKAQHPSTPGTGRIDKRAAILDAAFQVFARDGYANAAVDAIAAAAGVAKPTVYNHFTDKQTLFREALAADAERALGRNLAVVQRLSDGRGELRSRLEDLGARLIECYADDRSVAVRRLLCAEASTFPEIHSEIREQTGERVVAALADRFAHLVLDGTLRECDPAQAAEQFEALLAGPMEHRSRSGSRKVSAAARRAIAKAAADTFIRAYAR
ncbi:TetR/AcrR family transcriptional regulator C-terminal domain-containing protein [Sciscionella marina]|uniref:TetR/AcrR family transcriptional regulator C-terminal domain-containing protein n=1 Tax=Sciscionella marina TaxID=508770 RepID=UPI0003621F1E|nr:TetR/AcrR family transcriptional regulator C-terminal domain-containing protein [Sciscionella marina]